MSAKLLWGFLLSTLFGSLVLASMPRPDENIHSLPKPITENVGVRLIPVDVGVWPKNNDPGLCAQFDPKKMLTLSVFGKQRELLDPDHPQADSTLVEENQDPPPVGHLNMVILFDFYFLGFDSSKCRQGEPNVHEYGPIDPFDAARSMLRTSFRPGDRVMIARFMGYPRIDSPWLTSVDEAIALINQIEKSPLPPALGVRRTLDHWLEGMSVLATALGFYPGIKDLFIPIKDIPIGGGQSNDLLKYADVLARNRVRVHSIPTEPIKIVIPNGLRLVAEMTGGHYFAHEKGQLATAIQKTRAMHRCRTVVYFRPEPEEEKTKFRPGDMALGITDKRFFLSAPAQTYGLIRKNLTEAEERTAFLFLPHFEQGIRLEAGLMPVKPLGSKGDWEAQVNLKISLLDKTLAPELKGLVVDTLGIVNGRRSQTLEGAFSRYLDGSETKKLRETGQVTLSYPITAVWGKTEISAIAYAPDSEIQAADRAMIDLPKAPGPYWAISDRLGKFKTDILVLPMLDPSLPTNQQVMVRGFACTDQQEISGIFEKVDRTAAFPVPIFKVGCQNQVVKSTNKCSCLLAFMKEPLSEGEWEFRPPALTPSQSSQPIRFLVGKPK